MKKLMVMAAGVMLAVAANAASVGWTLAGAANYAGDAYSLFIVGQNNVESIATVTALLDAGSAVDAYAFGSGTVAANGAASVLAANSGKSLAVDGTTTYTAFFVIFDSATPTSGTSKYAVVSGASTLTQTPGATAAQFTFAAGNQSTYLNNASNWSSYGTPAAEPEPTSALMMLFGLAGLALRRKRA
jgi:hypothetical protein